MFPQKQLHKNGLLKQACHIFSPQVHLIRMKEAFKRLFHHDESATAVPTVES